MSTARYRDRYRTSIEGIGKVSVDTAWDDENATYSVFITVTRYNTDGKLCETRGVAAIPTTDPVADHQHWCRDDVLVPFLADKARAWPAPVYTPMPVYVNGEFTGYL